MKVHPDAASALADVSDGITLMSGGFGLSGNAECSIKELIRRGIKDLKVISNNIGNQGRGLAVLLKQRQISRAVCSYVGGNPDLQAQMLAGEVEVELSPQGTFAERIRAGGVGLGGFFTPHGGGDADRRGEGGADHRRAPLHLRGAVEGGLRHHPR